MLISLYIFLTFFILYIIIPFVFITYNNFDEGLNVYLKQISSVIFIFQLLLFLVKIYCILIYFLTKTIVL